MPPLTTSTGLTITNPLVLYRTLLATRKIEPDPAQHRLALHLQKLYFRLKDYQPEIDFRHRLKQLHRFTDGTPAASGQDEAQRSNQDDKSGWRVFRSIKKERGKTEALALTKRLTDHESAIQIQSPQGLLLHGEVGTGKSLLVDILADALPNHKKKRWHFNTFMLETFAKLESLRKNRLSNPHNADIGGLQSEEHSLLWLARDMISTSPILFLDEFQLPDRAASKILSNLLTSFFHLGGVLIATSNRMPEELANASGIEFTPPPSSRLSLFRGKLGLWMEKPSGGREDGMFSSKSDFTAFLEVLKARCEIWDMEGGRDWRRTEAELESSTKDVNGEDYHGISDNFDGLQPLAPGNVGLGYEQSAFTKESEDTRENASKAVLQPKNFLIIPSVATQSEMSYKFDERWKAAELSTLNVAPSEIPQSSSTGIPWETSSIRVYGRSLSVLRCLFGVTKWTFHELCASNLGPADYITLASTFHTFILTNVPILTLLQKNEARRFITLLDALYEARCKLLITAEAGPDDIFFPETRASASGGSQDVDAFTGTADGVYSETFAEIYQDANAPFRPNISAYNASASPPSYAPTTASPFSSTRTILADEDSDFGPTYGAGRGRGVGDGTPGSGHEIGRQDAGPDFTKIGAYTGEDERFAYKRARSRLWEMCSSRWWARQEDGWWRPLSKESRTWEGDMKASTPNHTYSKEEDMDISAAGAADEALFRHGASPFRTSPDPPPKFSFVHAWGMIKWGRKAGAWGQGPEANQQKGR